MSSLHYLTADPLSKHYVFIINPNSGKRRKIFYDEIIKEEFKSLSYQIIYTQKRGHATELASQYVKYNDHNIIGVGGDGTINEIAQALVHQSASMGIIPTGSGNGFAGHVIKDIGLKNSLEILKLNRTALCDTLSINNLLCCNTSGIGFSAYVAKVFDHSQTRGLSTYVKLGLSEFSKFPSFNLSVNSKLYQNQILLELTNSSQLGNKAFISPDASIQDGIAELVFLKKPGFLQLPHLIYDVFFGNLKKNSLTQHASTQHASIELEKENHLHIDGEYKGLTKFIELKMQPQSLRFIC